MSGIAQTFGVDWPHLGTQLVSFSILCVLLYRTAYGPVLRVLEARRQQIAQGLANAEQIKAELARVAADRDRVLAAAAGEAARIVEQARAAAARVRAEGSARAAAEAEQIVAKGRDAAARDRARMFAELKRDVGRLVLQTTAAVTGKLLTPDDQRRLAEETARQLAS